MSHNRRSDHHDRDRDRSRDSDYGYRDRRKPSSSSRYNEDYDDCYAVQPKDDPLKKALEGFSIPKLDPEEKKIEPKTKSLTDTINEKLLSMSSTSASDQNGSPSSGQKKNFCAGRKRTFEEIPRHQSWAEEYQPRLPDDIMLLCSSDRCDLCGVDITSSVLRDAHYQGSKHEKKVKARLLVLFPEEASRPKKARVDSSTDSGVAAALNFLKKIENQVDRDPTRATYGDMKLEEWQKIWMEKWDRPLPPAIVAMCRIVKCDICEACFNSGVMAKSHYEGKNHEKKLRACLELYCNKHGLELPRRVTSQAEASFRDSDNMCSLCDVELTSESMANIHYAGRKHIDKKLKQMASLSTISASEDKTGRFGIGSGFLKQEGDTRDNKSNDDLKDALSKAATEDGMDGRWGETESKPVALMSLDLENPKNNKFSPPKKLPLKPPDPGNYSCDVCKLGCLGNRQQWEAHINGKAHQKKLASETFHCEDCNVTSPNQSAHEMHIRGKAHARKRDAGEERVEGECGMVEVDHCNTFCDILIGGKLNCDLCMVTCTDEEQFKKHIEGKKHQAKCKSKSQSIFKCSVCNVTTTDQNGLNMHLQV